MELLNIAEKFDQYPGEELDLQQFVEIMREVIGPAPIQEPSKRITEPHISTREDYI